MKVSGLLIIVGIPLLCAAAITYGYLSESTAAQIARAVGVGVIILYAIMAVVILNSMNTDI